MAKKSKQKNAPRASAPASESGEPAARLSATERVEQRRADRARGRSAAAAARKRQKRIRQIAMIAAAVLALAFVSVFAYQRMTEVRPGEGVRDAGRQHIAEGTTGTGYTSDPPTSGQHWPAVAPWGVHDEPIPNELQIHNLEHGGVVMQYSCTDCDDIITELEGIADSCDVKLITAPRPGMEHLIAVTAWNRILTLDQMDRAAIVEFINAWADKGPERFPSETAAWNRCNIS